MRKLRPRILDCPLYVLDERCFSDGARDGLVISNNFFTAMHRDAGASGDPAC